MKHEAEEATGHLIVVFLSAPEPCNLDKRVRNYGVFIAGQFVVLPPGELLASNPAFRVE